MNSNEIFDREFPVVQNVLNFSIICKLPFSQINFHKNQSIPVFHATDAKVNAPFSTNEDNRVYLNKIHLKNFNVIKLDEYIQFVNDNNNVLSFSNKYTTIMTPHLLSPSIMIK